MILMKLVVSQGKMHVLIHVESDYVQLLQPSEKLC